MVKVSQSHHLWDRFREGFLCQEWIQTLMMMMMSLMMMKTTLSGNGSYKAACKRTQQLPTLLRQQCWELLGACWQWRANGCNNSQQCWDPQCNVGRIQPISLFKPCAMSVRGPNYVGRAVQTDPTLLLYASAISEQKKCWELLAEKFHRFCATTRNNIQQHATGCANARNM